MARLTGMVSFLLVTSVLVGCSGNQGNTPPLAPVSGKVTLDGKPMGGGEVRFSVPGQPVKVLEVKDGAFAGEVFTGKNGVEVVWEVDGGPNPMDPSTKLKVNKVDAKYLGPNSPFSEDIGKEGKSDLHFKVTSK
jgi:hypothetical protein